MALFEDLKRLFPKAGVRLRENVPMFRHSTFRIGGIADIFFQPTNTDEIIRITQYCISQGVPYLILGSGSNILVADAGIRGVVISIGNRYSATMRDNTYMIATAGTRLSALSYYAAQNGCSGLEFAAGIPGTVGGAVYMNAGAYDHCMAEIIVQTDYLDEHLQLQTLQADEHQFDYRHSFFTGRNCIILQTLMCLTEDIPLDIMERMAMLARRRKASQPLDVPSAGSVFKRPIGYYAGKLISDCGLKGCRLGNAQVSEKHAGFIVNCGKARADDVRGLIELVQQTVANKAGVHLETEIQFVGDWSHWPEQAKLGEVIYKS
jgi:UDP-N-acetylmuramate dehydrogenase